MSAKKKNDLPGWFPFAMASTVIVGLLAGAKSRWTLAKDMPPSPPPPPAPGVKGTPYHTYWP